MTLRLKHLKFPSNIGKLLCKSSYRDYDFDWTLDYFLKEVSPAELYVECKGFGKIKLRELTAFFFEIDEEKTIAWLRQSPNLLDRQPLRIKIRAQMPEYY